MTEDEWLACNDPTPMLRTISCLKPTERKTRLLNVAMCFLFWDYLTEASQAIVLESERLADGLSSATPVELCHRANSAVPPVIPNRIPDNEREAAKAVCYAVLPQEILSAAGTC